MRLLLALALLLSAAACVAAPDKLEVGEFGLISPDYGETPVEILAEDVTGEDCIPTSESRRPSYGRAVAAAIDSVPDANVLKAVRFSYEDRFTSLCAIVHGKAGRFR